jgi:ABC-2 type transport system ATP-binding protein
VLAPGELTRLLAGHGHYLEELTPVAADLESAFLELTGDAAPVENGALTGDPA